MDWFTYAAKETGCGSTDLQVILSDLRPVEHRVEGGDLVHLHRRHLQHLRCLVHGTQRQKVVVLLLSDEQDWNDSRRLVVVGVLGE